MALNDRGYRCADGRGETLPRIHHHPKVVGQTCGNCAGFRATRRANRRLSSRILLMFGPHRGHLLARHRRVGRCFWGTERSSANSCCRGFPYVPPPSASDCAGLCVAFRRGQRAQRGLEIRLVDGPVVGFGDTLGVARPSSGDVPRVACGKRGHSCTSARFKSRSKPVRRFTLGSRTRPTTNTDPSGAAWNARSKCSRRAG